MIIILTETEHARARLERQFRWIAGIQRFYGEPLLRRKQVIAIDDELFFMKDRGRRYYGIASVRGSQNLRTGNSVLPVRQLRVQQRNRNRIDVGTIGSNGAAAEQTRFAPVQRTQGLP